MTFIAGPYTATLNAMTIGIIEDGFDLENTADGKDLITGDNLGGSVQDGVYRGGQAFCSFTLLEPDLTQVKAALWPYAAEGVVGQVGRLDTNIAVALVLTAVAGTTAATEPATLTADLAILAENFPIRRLMASRARRIPMRLRLYPFLDSVIKWWNQT